MRGNDSSGSRQDMFSGHGYVSLRDQVLRLPQRAQGAGVASQRSALRRGVHVHTIHVGSTPVPGPGLGPAAAPEAPLGGLRGPEPGGHFAVVYNPLAWTVTTIVNLTVNFPEVNLTDETGNPVPAQSNQTIQVTQEFMEYHDNSDEGQVSISDNYVFAPNGTVKPAWAAVEMEILEGQLLTEIRQCFYRTVNDRDPVYTIYSRLARGPPGTDGELLGHRIQQEYTVGPLELNREAILRTSTNLITGTAKSCLPGHLLVQGQIPRRRDVMDQQGRVCSWVSQWFLPSTWEPFLQNRCCHETTRVHPDFQQQEAVTLPPSLHLQILSIPGWMYNSNHTKHLQNLQKGHQGQAKVDFCRVLLLLHHLYEKGQHPVLSQPVTVNLQLSFRNLGNESTTNVELRASDAMKQSWWRMISGNKNSWDQQHQCYYSTGVTGRIPSHYEQDQRNKPVSSALWYNQWLLG
ncbi:hypothetical protein JEQ12_017594 [Ovis aries]|uniref:Uncharacterized protein n=1 Tax=Ovis aries TaxID=9940 RepID=A0A836D4S2_SHEEP|nr:hypothetical protein JEQ12_017594 [Ovis aries]